MTTSMKPSVARWWPIGIATLILFAAIPMIVSAQRRPSYRDSSTYSGTSSSDNLDEALQNAIADAAEDVPCCDRQLEWRLREIRGIQGGIAGDNRMTVTIETRVR
ncbi:MAG TPA: hypothetical protein VJS92_01110 [Candidatus Polarisedimenticolaceae bacterium]|nr:hypothetical protein [Candidatus Polarisedimenticolaceae bacterium]